jgi:hypothetical protein
MRKTVGSLFPKISIAKIHENFQTMQPSAEKLHKSTSFFTFLAVMCMECVEKTLILPRILQRVQDILLNRLSITTSRKRANINYWVCP